KPSKKTPAGGAAQGDLFSDAGNTSDIADVAVPTNFKTIAVVPHEYILLDSDAKIENLLERLRQKTEYAFDTETTSLCTLDAELVGLSFALKAHEAYYLPLPA